jgi:hypothetical protein
MCGRPRKRWLDDIEEGLRAMKVKRRRDNPTEREVGKNRLGGQGTAWAVAPESEYSENCKVGHLYNLTTCHSWPPL